MSIPRTMMFLDGENLTLRYQAMVEDGMVPTPEVVHVPDVLVWHPDISRTFLYNLIRIYYYTSLTGDDRRIEETKAQISSVRFEYNYSMADEDEGGGQLVPVVFKKSRRSYKTRQVDIQIAIDMMRFAHDPSVELLVLGSGDGDYLPLVQEVMRHGKETNVFAFSSGLDSRLPYSVDDFTHLDDLFFAGPPNQAVQPTGSSGG